VVILLVGEHGLTIWRGEGVDENLLRDVEGRDGGDGAENGEEGKGALHFEAIVELEEDVLDGDNSQRKDAKRRKGKTADYMTEASNLVTTGPLEVCENMARIG
jgi:hypothetical protein